MPHVTLDLPDLHLVLETAPGLFSHQRIDPGTWVLLRYGPTPPAKGDILDLGCGYGPVAIAVAFRAPAARVWAIDVDDNALEVTERNLNRLGVNNVVPCTPRQVPPDVAFAALYSHPPYRIGRESLRALMAKWLGRLEPGGAAHFVVKQTAGADSLAAWLTTQGLRTDRIASKRGYRLLRHVR